MASEVNVNPCAFKLVIYFYFVRGTEKVLLLFTIDHVIKVAELNKALYKNISFSIDPTFSLGTCQLQGDPISERVKKLLVSFHCYWQRLCTTYSG